MRFWLKLTAAWLLSRLTLFEKNEVFVFRGPVCIGNKAIQQQPALPVHMTIANIQHSSMTKKSLISATFAGNFQIESPIGIPICVTCQMP